MSEKDIQSDILVTYNRDGIRLFRNQVGSGWQGDVTRGPSTYSMRLNAGDVLIRNARFLSAGLHPGSPDLIGWHTIEITPDMVGKKVAVFVGVEVKTKTGKPTPEQTNFVKQILDAGGIAGIARSVNDLEDIIHHEDGTLHIHD